MGEEGGGRKGHTMGEKKRRKRNNEREEKGFLYPPAQQCSSWKMDSNQARVILHVCRRPVVAPEEVGPWLREIRVSAPLDLSR